MAATHSGETTMFLFNVSLKIKFYQFDLCKISSKLVLSNW